ncbi:MgtC/SapB family protein [Roseococcus sp. SDR]|uniref:MgtC/SapB family protein n=1 Tax=Roseococcus sp. SDR TaxID=2835532 RepID=UPI001BD18886|nr:MgtC/SapB family protein [Roseococcus sp. SDR]MBV1847264.1 MgtC/SapB family protein [Roseococcus sp. SDR]
MIELLPEDATIYGLPLAFLLGAAVGAEREWRHKPGGLRTCALVALASAAVADLMLAQVTPANLGAGYGAVMTGVGFLGAGMIMRDGTTVRGLSTAATMWCVAAIGLLAGAAETVGALILAAMVLAVNILLRPVTDFVRRRRPEPRPDNPHED